MTCEHEGCSSHIFASCTNHCMKKICLEHIIEHEDSFFNDYQNLLSQLDKATEMLINETKETKSKVCD